jgi:hypothetical protein
MSARRLVYFPTWVGQRPYITRLIAKLLVRAGVFGANQAQELADGFLAQSNAEGESLLDHLIRTHAIEPGDGRAVLALFSRARFLCLDCATHSFGVELVTDNQLRCPHCSGAEFSMGGVASGEFELPVGVRDDSDGDAQDPVD